MGIEVKASATVNVDNFKGLRKLSSAGGDDFKLGLVLYDGERAVPFGERLVAAPISSLWALTRVTPSSRAPGLGLPFEVCIRPERLWSRSETVAAHCKTPKSFSTTNTRPAQDGTAHVRSAQVFLMAPHAENARNPIS